MVILAMTAIINASAQMEIKGAIDGHNGYRQYGSSISIPPEFCKDNTPFLILEKERDKDDNLVVLNDNLETVKEVTLNNNLEFSYQLVYQEKTRDIKSVSEEGKSEEDLHSTWQEVMQRELNLNPYITTKSFVYDVQPNGDSIIQLKVADTDFAHRTYFAYDTFQYKYPKVYWRCSQGKVFLVRNNYQIEYTDWTNGGTSTVESSLPTLPIPICYINLNNGNGGSNFEFYLSQTLFNQDDDFEYIVPKYTLINGSSTSVPQPTSPIYVGDDQSIILSSDSLISPSTVALAGFKVVNADGSVISETNFSSPFETDNSQIKCAYLIRIGSKLYLAFDGWNYDNGHTTYFYEINSSASSIRQVKAANYGMSIISNNINSQAHSFDVTFKDGNKEPSELIVTSATGTTLSRVKVPQGKTSTQLSVVSPKGIAIITRLQNGKVIESKKIVLK